MTGLNNFERLFKKKACLKKFLCRYIFNYLIFEINLVQIHLINHRHKKPDPTQDLYNILAKIHLDVVGS